MRPCPALARGGGAPAAGAPRLAPLGDAEIGVLAEMLRSAGGGSEVPGGGLGLGGHVGLGRPGERVGGAGECGGETPVGSVLGGAGHAGGAAVQQRDGGRAGTRAKEGGGSGGAPSEQGGESGTVSRKEAKVALSKVAPENELDSICDAMDLDRKGEIDREELQDALRGLSLSSYGVDRDRLRELFAAVSAVGPGGSQGGGPPGEGQGRGGEEWSELSDMLAAHDVSLAGIGDLSAMSRGDFEQRVVDGIQRKIKRDWLLRGGVLDMLVDLLPGGDVGDVVELARSGLAGGRMVVDLSEIVLKLGAKDAEARRRGGEDGGGGGHGNAKFDQMFLGDISEFYQGIEGLLGAPDPCVLAAMEKEHVGSADSHDAFTTNNYGLTTTSAAEWEVVTSEDEGVRDRVKGLHDRRVVHYRRLGSQAAATCREANLGDAEVIAMVLYTGPMFQKYNAVLRGFPAAMVGACRGNMYATTIHALVSGVKKVQRVTRVPEGGRVYRGVAGMKLPDAFFRSNALGFGGGTEMGMLSTTTRRHVAMSYSARGKGAGMVLEIAVEAVNRPASIRFLSQYPGEEELLFVPRAYLQLGGDPRWERAAGGGEVLVVPLQVSANTFGLTLDEHVERKKRVVLDMYRLKLGEVRAGRNSLALEVEGMRSAGDRRFMGDNAVKAFEDLGERLRALSAQECNRDEVFKAAVTEVLEAGDMANSLFDLARDAVKEPAQLFELTNLPMRACHRVFIREKEEVVVGAGKGGAEVREAALLILRKMGIVSRGVDEANEVGESVLLRMVIDMPDKVLLACQAGANVGATDGRGRTALHHACEYGRFEAIRTLVDFGADARPADRGRAQTPLSVAAEHGHAECIAWLAGRFPEAAVDRDEDQASPLHYAAQNGHTECVRELLLKGAEIEAEDNSGWTALHRVAIYGHCGCAKVLLEMGASTDAEDTAGCTPLHGAAEYGFEDVVRELLLHGARTDAKQMGKTPVDLACTGYQVSQDRKQGIVQMLLEASQRQSQEARGGGGAGRAAGPLSVIRGWKGSVQMEGGADALFVAFSGTFCTVMSRDVCPRGRRVYYEIEVVRADIEPQFGFAVCSFAGVDGPSGDGVGDDFLSWAVDGTRRLKFHGDSAEYPCTWQEGDVVGLACDLVGGKVYVSVNGDFSPPNGAVFEAVDAPEGRGVCAAFTGHTGHVRCNLGGGQPFRHKPPSLEDGRGNFVGFAELVAGHE